MCRVYIVGSFGSNSVSSAREDGLCMCTSVLHECHYAFSLQPVAASDCRGHLIGFYEHNDGPQYLQNLL